ncbi:MAG: T9SS type A sorting domain-containing protein, partial [Ginsengibacter sp.]
DLENKWSLTQILNNISAALPLTLLDLSVIKDHKNAAVKWETANEVNVAYFNLQRSGDGINFTNVARLGARNNGLQNSYVFNDDLSSTKAGKVFYRLQMVDNDGRFSFSKIVYVTVDADGLLMSIRPNPAHDYFIISNYINTNGVEANLILRDVSGRTLISKKLSAETEQRINISTLLKGIYTVSITTPQKVVTQKLVVN